MVNHVRKSRLTALLLLACVSSTAFAEPGFKDPLDFPARIVSGVVARPLMAVASAGARLVAVGSRGLVIVSLDRGKTWTQSKVPVQSDLLAVHFPTATTGWVVGHDGVILRSDDGGDSWVKQLDGRSAADAFRKYYEMRLADGDATAKQALLQVTQNFKAGSALPYLDVWFEDTRTGYAVGSYGMLITTADGGKTWTPWLDRIESDQLNLNSVRGTGGDVLIAGEQGRVYRLDRDKGRFVTAATGYGGSFFGLAANSTTVLAFGLRGVAYRSDDKGLSWEEVKMPSEATVSAGAVSPDDASFLLVNGAGQILVGSPDARRFKIVQPQRHMRLTGMFPLSKNEVVITGLGGVTTERLSPSVN